MIRFESTLTFTFILFEIGQFALTNLAESAVRVECVTANNPSHIIKGIIDFLIVTAERDTNYTKNLASEALRKQYLQRQSDPTAVYGVNPHCSIIVTSNSL